MVVSALEVTQRNLVLEGHAGAGGCEGDLVFEALLSLESKRTAEGQMPLGF